MYGRGAADMKAGIVAYTQAFRALQKLGYEPAAPVYLQSVVEEECTGNGALACLVEGYTADAAIIPEPFEGVMSAQMGVMWLTIDVHGLPVHASVAHTGMSAIGYAQQMVEWLKELETAWNRPAARHACYAGHPHPINFNLGKISGGEWASSVPTHCRVDMRLGFYPGRTPAEVRAEVEAHLAASHARHPGNASLKYSITYQGFQAQGCVVDIGAPAIQQLLQAHRDIAGTDAPLNATPATTDVRFFHLYGQIPSTCYGPNGSDIHGIDEWVSLSSMQRVTAVLALYIARWCGLEPAGRLSTSRHRAAQPAARLGDPAGRGHRAQPEPGAAPEPGHLHAAHHPGAAGHRHHGGAVHRCGGGAEPGLGPAAAAGRRLGGAGGLTAR